jgi:hypothetical protein
MRDTSLKISSDAGGMPAQARNQPEEMLFALELRLPGQSAVVMRFRTTPAGLIATGLMTMMTLAGVALILRRR